MSVLHLVYGQFAISVTYRCSPLFFKILVRGNFLLNAISKSLIHNEGPKFMYAWDTLYIPPAEPWAYLTAITALPVSLLRAVLHSLSSSPTLFYFVISINIWYCLFASIFMIISFHKSISATKLCLVHHTIPSTENSTWQIISRPSTNNHYINE